MSCQAFTVAGKCSDVAASLSRRTSPVVTPKRHHKFHLSTITSAIVLPQRSGGVGSWGLAVRRKNKVGFERESPTHEATLERVERLADLLTLSYEPMLAWRLDGPIEFWNAGAERLYGFARNEAVGRISHALLQTEFPIDFADLRSQLKDRRDWSGELRHICKDGSQVAVESHMQLFSDSLVLEANRDITKPVEIEAALRESEQQLRWLASIVESSDDAIVSKNLDGVITSWNSGAERVFGQRGDRSAHYTCDPCGAGERRT